MMKRDNNAAVVIVVVVNKDLSKFVKAGGTLCEASRPTLSWFHRKKTLQWSLLNLVLCEDKEEQTKLEDLW
ncbi:hypothetical protein Scep_024181 [Stephania cephalantha]|uniref:Uncharacterized protein n=1 Tax=Stephania cephalantha TaxID=152367 RepID=A0AAP0EX81_9MAGN